jgi:hypothetical protein
MNQETIVKILQMQQENSTSLQALSNDIQKPAPDKESSSDDEDEEDLNSSSNSFVSRYHTNEIVLEIQW